MVSGEGPEEFVYALGGRGEPQRILSMRVGDRIRFEKVHSGCSMTRSAELRVEMVGLVRIHSMVILMQGGRVSKDSHCLSPCLPKIPAFPD